MQDNRMHVLLSIASGYGEAAKRLSCTAPIGQ